MTHFKDPAFITKYDCWAEIEKLKARQGRATIRRTPSVGQSEADIRAEMDRRIAARLQNGRALKPSR